MARDPGANIPLNILMIGEVGPWASAVAEVWHYNSSRCAWVNLNNGASSGKECIDAFLPWAVHSSRGLARRFVLQLAAGLLCPFLCVSLVVFVVVG